MGNSTQLFLRKDYTKKDGTNPIYLRVIINREKKDYSLNISVLPKHWNSKKSAIKLAAPISVQSNLLLQKYIQKAKDIIFKHTIEDKYLNLYEFDKLFKSNSFNNKSFYDFVEKQIKTQKGILTPGTLHIYETQLSKLKQFRISLDFGQIDIPFLKEYENYMATTLNNNINTISKSLSFIRNILNKAIQEGIINENIFNKHKYKLRHAQTKREYLTMSEIEKLEKLLVNKELKPNKENVLKYFLFSCYTGLRYGDVKKLKYKDLENNTVRIITEKKKKPVEIPLSQKAIALAGSGLDNLPVFKVLTDQPTNRYLKEICKTAGIKKNISFHCSRHTFATNCVEMGIPIQVVKELLAHSDIKETLIYAKTTLRAKEEAIRKWEENQKTDIES
jgi:integrase